MFKFAHRGPWIGVHKSIKFTKELYFIYSKYTIMKNHCFASKCSQWWVSGAGLLSRIPLLPYPVLSWPRCTRKPLYEQCSQRWEPGAESHPHSSCPIVVFEMLRAPALNGGGSCV